MQFKIIFGIIAVAAALWFINGGNEKFNIDGSFKNSKEKAIKEDARQAAEVNCELKFMLASVARGNVTALTRLSAIEKTFTDLQKKLEEKYTSFEERQMLEREMELIMQELGCATPSAPAPQRANQPRTENNFL